MSFALAARKQLDANLERLRDEHLVVLELTELRDLVRDPDTDPMAVRRGPERAGVDDLAATLAAARRLPEDLTVRVVLPERTEVVPPVAEAEAALHGRAHYLASVAWREGMAQRAMGLRQLPLGIAISVVCWGAAYLAGYLATQADSGAIGVLAVTGMILITISWVVSWWVVESTMLDWRPDARLAAGYDLLSRARLEVTTGDGLRLGAEPTS